MTLGETQKQSPGSKSEPRMYRVAGRLEVRAGGMVRHRTGKGQNWED